MNIFLDIFGALGEFSLYLWLKLISHRDSRITVKVNSAFGEGEGEGAGLTLIIKLKLLKYYIITINYSSN